MSRPHVGPEREPYHVGRVEGLSEEDRDSVDHSAREAPIRDERPETSIEVFELFVKGGLENAVSVFCVAGLLKRPRDGPFSRRPRCGDDETETAATHGRPSRGVTV